MSLWYFPKIVYDFIIGSYCSQGLALSCPVGTYGATAGLTTSSCSGFCSIGSYGAKTGLTTATCSGPCEQGILL